MKIKDIVLREADVTLKPMPGAQEVDIDGKAVGTATTPAAATAISDLAKKGEFTPAGDEQQASEDADTGFNDTSALMPTSNNFDDKAMDAMAQGMVNAVKQLPPEYQAAAEQLIVRDAEGNVDGDETMLKMFTSLGEISVQIYQLFEQLTTKMEQFIKTPEFAKNYPDPAEQQRLIKDVADMRAQLPELKAGAEKAKQATGELNKKMRPEIDRRANAAFKDKTGLDMVRGGAGQKTNIGFDPKNPGGKGEQGFAGESTEQLARIRKLSGLAEAQSIYPSRNDPALAQQAAQTQPGHQSVMPSRNKPQYTADEMTAILSGQKTQQQVDAEKAAGTKEGHQDLVSQGNHDVGGDATDRFINQVRDKGFEKANKHGGSVSRSPLSEKDELYKWLTIAGIK
jgi:hypothetical protein